MSMIEEYIHSIISTIIFVSAITFLIIILGFLSDMAEIVYNTDEKRASVILDKSNAVTYYDEHIYEDSTDVLMVSNSQIYTDIMSYTSDITIVYKGTVLNNLTINGKNVLSQARELDREAIQFLINEIGTADGLNNEQNFRKICEYDYKTGNLKKVEYRY